MNQTNKSKRKHKGRKGRKVMFYRQCLNWRSNYNKISRYILDPSSPSLHTIVELSRTHMNHYKHNMIVLSGLQVQQIENQNKNKMENRDFQYGSIEFGKKVQVTNTCCEGIQYTTIQLERMKNNHVIIVVKLNELEALFPDQLVTISSQPCLEETNGNRWRHKSGYIMLARAVLDKRDKNFVDTWEEKDYKLLRKVKNSIVGNKNTPHFGASGNYFLFGMNGLYRIDDKKSSIGVYRNKRGKDEEQNQKIEEASNWLEDKLQASLQNAVYFRVGCFYIAQTFFLP